MFIEKEEREEEIEDYINYWSVCWVGKIMFVLLKLYGYNFFVKYVELKVEELVNVICKGLCYVMFVFLCLIVIEIFDVVFVFDLVLVVIVVI